MFLALTLPLPLGLSSSILTVSSGFPPHPLQAPGPPPQREDGVAQDDCSLAQLGSGDRPRGADSLLGRVLPGVRGVSAHTGRVSKGRFPQRNGTNRYPPPPTSHTFTQILREPCFAGLFSKPRLGGGGLGAPGNLCLLTKSLLLQTASPQTPPPPTPASLFCPLCCKVVLASSAVWPRAS